MKGQEYRTTVELSLSGTAEPVAPDGDGWTLHSTNVLDAEPQGYKFFWTWARKKDRPTVACWNCGAVARATDDKCLGCGATPEEPDNEDDDGPN